METKIFFRRFVSSKCQTIKNAESGLKVCNKLLFVNCIEGSKLLNHCWTCLLFWELKNTIFSLDLHHVLKFHDQLSVNNIIQIKIYIVFNSLCEMFYYFFLVHKCILYSVNWIMVSITANFICITSAGHATSGWIDTLTSVWVAAPAFRT